MPYRTSNLRFASAKGQMKTLTSEQYAKAIFGTAKGVEHFDGSTTWTWSKNGGHPNAFLRRVYGTLAKLKFVQADRTSFASPDGNVVGGGTLYAGPGGTVLVRSSYGVVAADNHFRITYKAVT